MMEAARTSETLVNFYQTTRCYNPEDSNLHTHRRENLKTYLVPGARNDDRQDDDYDEHTVYDSKTARRKRTAPQRFLSVDFLHATGETCCLCTDAVLDQLMKGTTESN
jgi:hypothetical protein